MKRSPESLFVLARAQGLKKLAMEAQLRLLQARMQALFDEEQACISILSNEKFATEAVARSMSRRIAVAISSRELLRKQIEKTEGGIRAETTRAEKIQSWIEISQSERQEEELGQVLEESTAFKFRTSAE